MKRIVQITASQKQMKKHYNIQKRVVTGIIVACVCVIILIVLAMVIIFSNKYHSAMQLYNEKKYQDAYMVFNEIPFKGSKDKASECLFLMQKSNLTDIKVGDIIKFGSYEQDNNRANGKEEIEWVVLDVENNKALVVSKYILDIQPYNKGRESEVSVTWERCSLRKWLNDNFLNTAFGVKHQELIPSVSIFADTDQTYKIHPDNAITTDKIFILGKAEVEKYFASEEARRCILTAYADDNIDLYGYDHSSPDETHWWWWVRSHGLYQDWSALIVLDNGTFKGGFDAIADCIGVRPALWINIDSQFSN